LLIRRFSKSAAFTGAILLVASLTGLLIANSPLSAAFERVLAYNLAGNVWGAANLDFSAERLLNEGLMTLFFLAVTLEIKKEMTAGHLDTLKQAILPAIGAIGGMLTPAVIYCLCTWHTPYAMRGWAIPAATDAAFTLPIIASLGTRIGGGLRSFAMALAIFDDVLAILVIAFFYSTHLSLVALMCAGVMLAVIVWLNLAGVRRLSPYAIAGLLLWACMLESGLHATLAGVLLGLSVPSGSKAQAESGALSVQRMERAIQPFVVLVVLPLFGFVNVAVRFDDQALRGLISPVGFGVAAGLFLGKQLGVFICVYGATKFGWAQMPGSTSVKALYGVSILCGIGFTISLFISGLSFGGSALLGEAKLGILVGSALSGIAGWTWLYVAVTKPHTTLTADA
jgi:Na+:H+ antiporter, NhaA family